MNAHILTATLKNISVLSVRRLHCALLDCISPPHQHKLEIGPTLHCALLICLLSL